jgi:hypothetical protein
MPETDEDIIDRIDVQPFVSPILAEARDEIIYLRNEMALLMRGCNELKQRLLTYERTPDRVHRSGHGSTAGKQAPGAPAERADGDVRPVQAPEVVEGRRRL